MNSNKEPLANQKCVPCEGIGAKLSAKDIAANLKQVKGWRVENNHHLSKAFKFRDFVSALAFVNQVGEIAEQQGHHPDILLSWGKVEITLFTHALKGLSMNDFILAAKIDEIQ